MITMTAVATGAVSAVIVVAFLADVIGLLLMITVVRVMAARHVVASVPHRLRTVFGSAWSGVILTCGVRVSTHIVARVVVMPILGDHADPLSKIPPVGISLSYRIPHRGTVQTWMGRSTTGMGVKVAMAGEGVPGSSSALVDRSR